MRETCRQGSENAGEFHLLIRVPTPRLINQQNMGKKFGIDSLVVTAYTGDNW
jgi:hypothetical protein